MSKLVKIEVYGASMDIQVSEFDGDLQFVEEVKALLQGIELGLRNCDIKIAERMEEKTFDTQFGIGRCSFLNKVYHPGSSVYSFELFFRLN